MLDLLIRGGDVVTPQGVTKADVGIEDGRIAAVGLEVGSGKEEIDAHGLHLLPGVIDAHLHFLPLLANDAPHRRALADAAQAAIANRLLR